MEFRKVQKTGGSTYIISLPKDWVIKNKITEGDTLQLKELKDGSIILSTKIFEENEHKEIYLVIENEKEDLILRKLIAIYLAGFDTIKIVSKSVLSEQIKSAVNKFTILSLGVEIVEESNNSILLQDLSKFSDLPIEKMLQRLYNMTENMLLDVKELYSNFNENFAMDIIERDMQLDRVFWLISKQFYMALKNSNILRDLDIDITKAFNIRSIAKLFERIGDHAVNISNMMLENRITDGKELLQLFNYATELFMESYHSYRHLDLNQANSVIERAHEFSNIARKTINELNKKRGKELIGMAFIIESLIRIAMYSSDIAEITIDEGMLKEKT